ncbi:MAG: 1-phosphofructokinase family hexose kinase [Ferruginibacter sp.]|nr:1-phosphofructokinase family hexose kinase [Ferruginibacter sp.]
MPKIITITLNPAIDKSTSVPVLVPEKKMKCTLPVFEPGGGGINVARAIKKLGGNATALYLAGGYTGKFFTQLLDRENIDSIVIEMANHTRENLIVLNSTANLQYRFGMPGPLVEDVEWKKLLDTLEKINGIDFIVASGSLPPGVPVDIYARIASVAKRKGTKCVVDTSGEALQLAAEEGVYLLKPNLGELSSLVGSEEISTGMVDDVAATLIENGRSEVVLVSMGAAGAMLVTKQTVKQLSAPVVKRISTVGAGDSMVAGIIMGLSKGFSILESAKYGVASGTAATINPGTELCRLEDVERLYPLIKETGV